MDIDVHDSQSHYSLVLLSTVSDSYVYEKFSFTLPSGFNSSKTSTSDAEMYRGLEEKLESSRGTIIPASTVDEKMSCSQW